MPYQRKQSKQPTDTRKSKTPEQEKHPPNGGKAERTKLPPDYETWEKEEEEEEAPSPKRRGGPGTMAKKPKSRVSKARFQHVSNPFNEICCSGTIMSEPRFDTTKNGSDYVYFRFAIYMGKDQSTGEYRPSVFIGVRMYRSACESFAKDGLDKGYGLKLYGQVTQFSIPAKHRDEYDTYVTEITADWYEITREPRL